MTNSNTDTKSRIMNSQLKEKSPVSVMQQDMDIALRPNKKLR